MTLFESLKQYVLANGWLAKFAASGCPLLFPAFGFALTWPDPKFTALLAALISLGVFIWADFWWDENDAPVISFIVGFSLAAVCLAMYVALLLGYTRPVGNHRVVVGTEYKNDDLADIVRDRYQGDQSKALAAGATADGLFAEASLTEHRTLLLLLWVLFWLGYALAIAAFLAKGRHRKNVGLQQLAAVEPVP